MEIVPEAAEETSRRDPLAARLADGDPRATRELVERHQAELYRYALAMLRDVRDDALPAACAGGGEGYPPRPGAPVRLGRPRGRVSQGLQGRGERHGEQPVPLLVPCHWVVRNDGRTGNYAFGAGEKVRLLKMEGASPEEVARAPYVATPTTGIVCHATCRNARRIHPENRRPFRSASEAVQAGYRPCRVCRPAATPSESPSAT